MRSWLDKNHNIKTVSIRKVIELNTLIYFIWAILIHKKIRKKGFPKRVEQDAVSNGYPRVEIKNARALKCYILASKKDKAKSPNTNQESTLG